MHQSGQVRPLRVHTKQFILGPQFIAALPDWREYAIGAGRILSADPALNVQQLRSADGVRYWPLGYAVLSDRKERQEAAFAKITSDVVVDWTANWTGRWLLITPEYCVPDASGSLGLFYRTMEESLWLSSSVALLAHYIPGQSVPASIPWGATHERGLDWIPAPLSTRKGILKLLPFRRISMRTGQVSPVSMPSLRRSTLNPIADMASRLVTIAHNASFLPFTERLVFLTAGLDTRTMLSAFIAAQVSCQTMTSVRPGMAEADERLPPMIAASAGIPHKFVHRAGMSQRVYEDRLRIVKEHTDGQAVGTSADHCVHAQASHATESTIRFGGLCFELGRCFFWKRLGPTDTKCLLARFYRDPIDQRWHDAISMWVTSLSDNIPLQMDWRDRFYLEQRLGGWASANHQCNDIMVGVLINLANCAMLFQIMLQIPEEERQSGIAQKEIIRLLAPELAKYPINPQPWRKVALQRSGRMAGLLSAKLFSPTQRRLIKKLLKW